MSPAHLRWLLHATHALASLLLIATGLLIQWPELRAALVGGYGLEIARLHDWIGVLFIGLPLGVLALAARPILRDLRRRLGPPDPPNWRKFHIVASLAVSVLLSASGILLWVDPDVPRAVWEASLELHIALSWLLIVSIPIHLFAARRKMASVTRVWLGLEEAPGPELGDEHL